MTPNQNPEQLARDQIDAMLIASGWVIQSKNSINLKVKQGVAVREYQTDIGPADYVLFVDAKPVGVIEAKRAEEAVRLSVHEDQTEGYATARLKYCNNEKLPFVYESTGDVTRFTDFRDTKPRSRPVFSFHRPETFAEYLKQGTSLRTRLHDIPPLECASSSPLERSGEVFFRDCRSKPSTTLKLPLNLRSPKHSFKWLRVAVKHLLRSLSFIVCSSMQKPNAFSS